MEVKRVKTKIFGNNKLHQCPIKILFFIVVNHKIILRILILITILIKCVESLPHKLFAHIEKPEDLYIYIYIFPSNVTKQ